VPKVDGDGHRVSKTVNGTTINYATRDINPSGYPQVLRESHSPAVYGGENQHTYVYGLEGVLELREATRRSSSKTSLHGGSYAAGFSGVFNALETAFARGKCAKEPTAHLRSLSGGILIFYI
jgi:hypothetical protein